MGGFWKLRALLVLAGTCLVSACFGQTSTGSEETEIGLHPAAAPSTCSMSVPTNAVEAALRLVCLRDNPRVMDIVVQKTIIIGFVGGFVRSDDTKHPEVQFAAHLREAYPSEVHAEVFSNHDGKHALSRVLQLLSEGGDGVPTPLEKKKAKVIIYGHSVSFRQSCVIAKSCFRR
jgi:hypothetical protein